MASENNGDKRNPYTTQVSIGPVIYPYPFGDGNKLLIDPEKLENSSVGLDEARVLMHRLEQELAAYDGNPSIQYREHLRKSGMKTILTGGIASLLAGAIAVSLNPDFSSGVLVLTIPGLMEFVTGLIPGTDHDNLAT